MDKTVSATRRGIVFGLVIGLVAVALWSATSDAAEAAPGLSSRVLGYEISDDVLPPIVGGWYARYEGIDGEADDLLHEDWVEILGYEWGLATSAVSPASVSRRRSAAEVNDLFITLDYEKASPKLLEMAFKSQVIPRVEIELTRSLGEDRGVYLRYELTNVLLTSYEVGGYADGTPPTVVVGHNFEKIKVTYTEYDDAGNSMGNVETEIKPSQGA